ncbi:DEP domain containing protein [Tieghemostelium lacteum]|uniref:DEP domain containing protein n=1 Tax=Tieghemostelium lacteum TaxID=361077 RepID=A0A152A7Z4_TIELA|nr:DEP domain containing protein [Tieghemostelium lacteum]|eukprot:KYR02324.1 DEP domain containing protein [Tieghemostelium lacteum]
MNKKSLFILWVHDQSFSKEELVINPEHFPKLKVGDIVEVSSTTNTTKTLCLRVKTLAPVRQSTLQISIAKYIAQVFDFSNRREVIVNIIPEKKAHIDFIELSFKDQYIGRSDMWRLKLSLQNECVYVFKKLAFAQIRAQVEEIVSNGQKISSGLIDENTKFVFRSRSAKFVLFIQMSKEMWDYSTTDGELYFEKAVNGFLKSLFQRWKSLSVNHTITIILFSRTFHESTEILNEINNIPRNSQGKLYQDFYKVVVSEETRPDWSSIIVNLKKEFNNYHTNVNWDIYGRNSALGQNSTASQGNFLEAINLGMSYFDKHYIDRDFTRTGQMIVVVSAGTGIFEVDQDINLITKQRMIDNGIGCDLICLNKHPLHIVPLFKYNDKSIDLKDQYNVPYWLAISFYDESINNSTSTSTSNNNNNNSNELSNSGNSLNNSSNYVNSNNSKTEEKEGFVPQFRIPEKHINSFSDDSDQPVYDFYIPKDPRKFPGFSLKSNHKYTSHSLGVNSYEDTIFNLPLHEGMSGDANQYSMESSIVDDYMPSDTDQSDFSDTEDNVTHSTTPNANIGTNLIPKRKSQTTPHLQSNNRNINQNNNNSNHHTSKYSSYERKSTVQRHITNSSGKPAHNQHLNYHVHHQPPQSPSGGNYSYDSKNRSILDPMQPQQSSTLLIGSKTKNTINPFTYDSSPFHLTSNRRRWSHLWFSPNTYIFGKTNANPNPFLPNWKSLCEPASLPITTDYFPNEKELKAKYFEYVHSLSPDDDEYVNNIEALLKELISQRLAQGYQLIMEQVSSSNTASATSANATAGGTTPPSSTSGTMTPTTPTAPLSTTPTNSMQFLNKRTNKKTSYQLSLGHDFHLVTCDPSTQTIQVKRYQRQYRNQTKSIKYNYFLCTIHHSSFIYQSTNLVHQISSTYPWNTVDNIICGTMNSFRPTLKYWRIQYTILPTIDNQQLQQQLLLQQQQQLLQQQQQQQQQQLLLLQQQQQQQQHQQITIPIQDDTNQNENENNNNNNNNNTAPTTTTTPTIIQISTSPNVSTNNLGSLMNLSVPTSPVSIHKTNNIHNNSNIIKINTPINYKSPPNMSSSGPTILNSNNNSSLNNSNMINNSSSSALLTGSSSITSPSNDQSALPEHNEEERIAAFMKFKEYLNSQISRNNNTSQHTNKMEVKACTLSSIEGPTSDLSLSAGNNNSIVNSGLIGQTTILSSFTNTIMQSSGTTDFTVPLATSVVSSSIIIGGNRSNLTNSTSTEQPDPLSISSMTFKEKLTPNNIEGIYYRMNLPPPIGLKLVDKKYRLRNYKKCWVASEGLEWLEQNVEIATREEAINLAQIMMDQKYIKHVEKAQFSDGFHFYRLKEDEPFISPPIKKQESSVFLSNQHNNSTISSGNNSQIQSQQSSMVNSPIRDVNSPEQSPISSPKQSSSSVHNTTSSSLNVNNNNSNNGNSKTPTNMLGTSIKHNDSFILGSEHGTAQNLDASPSNSYHSTMSDSKTSTPIPTTPFNHSQNQLSYSSQHTFFNPAVPSSTNPNSNLIDTYENPNNTDEIRIEMDSTKTDRYEWILMRYDKTFCPTRYFHMEFKWMVSTGCVVDDFINTCVRKAKQFGLSLMQIPMEKNYSPFYSPFHVRLDPQLKSAQALKFILSHYSMIPDFIRKRPSSLVKRSDLYLFSDDYDVTEYIHKTGLLIVRVVEDGFLCYINNAPSNRQLLPAALQCLEGFQELVNKFNRSIPSIIYPSPDSPLDHPYSMLADASPQTNLLRSLPPQEANFLSLFAQGITQHDNNQIDDEANQHPTNSTNNTDTENDETDGQYEDQLYKEQEEMLYYSGVIDNN